MRVVNKTKDGVTLKFSNGDYKRVSWQSFNEYFVVNEDNQVTVKENPVVLAANEVYERALALYITKLQSKGDNEKIEKINSEIDELVSEILEITGSDDEESRKRILNMISDEGWDELNRKKGTTFGDIPELQKLFKAKFSEK